jgi:hypothetical protein
MKTLKRWLAAPFAAAVLLLSACDPGGPVVPPIVPGLAGLIIGVDTASVEYSEMVVGEPIPFVVFAFDGNADPLGNVSVTLAVVRGSATLNATQQTTDALGTARFSATPTGTGRLAVSATAGGSISAEVEVLVQ